MKTRIEAPAVLRATTTTTTTTTPEDDLDYSRTSGHAARRPCLGTVDRVVTALYRFQDHRVAS